ncbi:TPA: nucleotidyltransferase domain-containing protein, partial [Citrobacter freundii]|nr:nucleotidyltransferase domain-containing protein [Escherichia coli]HCC6825210.1 nucleotidyltransferase domain-containing protein [Citrobacter freundii]
MLNYEEESFAVLFGSVARGDYNKNSDIDILLCNYPEDKAKKNIASINLPQLPVNFVLYDSNMLWKFHEEGSLFLYHIFKQGKLIDGDALKWSEICQSFVVKKS